MTVWNTNGAPPPVVREFAKKAHKLLERDGTSRINRDGREVRTYGGLYPLWILGWNDPPWALFVSLPALAGCSQANRHQIYEEGNHGQYWDIAQCGHYLPMLTRKLILEELADIPED